MENKRKIMRVAFVAEESLNYFISIFVTSTFLGYLLAALGFNDATQGIINNVATLSCGAQIFALFLSGRKAKRTVTFAMLFSQIAFIAVYLLPISNFSSGAKSLLFVIFLVAGNLVTNAVLPARMVWLMRSVDDEKRGRFTAVKEMISLAGGVIVSMLLGNIADTYRDSLGNPTAEYYTICLVALIIMTVMHTVSLAVCHEDEVESEKISVKDSAKSLLKNKSIAKIMVIDILWQISLGLSTPFYPSYLRQELSMSFTVITIITTLGLISRLILSPLMGKIADKKSFTYSIMLCLVMQGIAFVGVIFTAPGWTKWFYVIYSCFYGFAMAGMNSGSLNLVYDFVSPEDRTVAIGVKAAVGGFAGFGSALVSGYMLEQIQQSGGVTIFGVNLYAQQVLSFASLIVVILAYVYINQVVRKMKSVKSDLTLSSSSEM
ncbi:MAG: MFS transporter [Clostridia bacterium]|nr:MFS transporter [Clostridia bacterium]